MGGSLAGVRAVEEARALGHQGPVTLICAESHLPYDRTVLSKRFLGKQQAGVATLCSERVLRRELCVDLRLGEAVQALDPWLEHVEVDGVRIAYDALIVATGAAPRMLPGAEELTGVHGLRTIEDGLAIRAGLDRARNVVVVGAGLIGLEVATAACNRGLGVTVVEPSAAPMEDLLGTEISDLLKVMHKKAGVRLQCGVEVVGLTGSGQVSGVKLSTDAWLPAELVVLDLGTVAHTGWLEGSGARLEDGVLCDSKLCTGIPGVYAAGAVARWLDPRSDALQRLDSREIAMRQATLAVRNALAPAHAMRFSDVLSFRRNWYGHDVEFVGESGHDAAVVVAGNTKLGQATVLYRKGTRISGVLAIDMPGAAGAYRPMIVRRSAWNDALPVPSWRRARQPVIDASASSQ
ncbi:NAD(P)/FAD-dependent oxidoreductase [Amycolatopsis japonica]